MRGVGALASLCLQKAPLPEPVQEEVEQELFGTTRPQPAAKLAEDRVIKAGIVEGESKGVLPIDPGADRIGRLAVGEVFGELEEGDQRQPPGGLGRLPALREQVGQIPVLHEHLEFIPDP